MLHELITRQGLSSDELVVLYPDSGTTSFMNSDSNNAHALYSLWDFKFAGENIPFGFGNKFIPGSGCIEVAAVKESRGWEKPVCIYIMDNPWNFDEAFEISGGKFEDSDEWHASNLEGLTRCTTQLVVIIPSIDSDFSHMESLSTKMKQTVTKALESVATEKLCQLRRLEIKPGIISVLQTTHDGEMKDKRPKHNFVL